MALIVVAFVMALLGFDVLTIRAMAIRRVGLVWWVALGLLMTLGVLGGCWGALGEWHPSTRIRAFGFPFPVGCFVLEGDDWVDYVSPFGPLVAVLNFVTFVVISILPLSIAYAIRRLRRSRGKVGRAERDSP